MNQLNVILIEGNLARDPQLKYSSAGKAVCSFAIGVNRSWKKDGQWVNEASFFDVDAWGKLAETCAQYQRKGSGVRVVGSLRQDRWEADGVQRSRVKIIAEHVEFMPKREKAGGAEEGAAQQEDVQPVEETEDIPF